jgi:hypothetical protein
MREFGERYRRPIEVETEEEKARLDQLLESKRKLSQDMLNGCGDVGPGEFADIERGRLLRPNQAGELWRI